MPPRGYPIELTLFSEADLVKVLGNSYFNDFDRERDSVDIKAEDDRQHLAALRGRCASRSPTGGLDEDDMVDLLDYFGKRYGKSMEALKADFWRDAIDLAPRLPPAAARQAVVGVLGHRQHRAHRDLCPPARRACQHRRRAHRLRAARRRWCAPKGEGYEWSPESILNVDVLNRLGKDDAEPLMVLPVARRRASAAETPLPRSLLAALTAGNDVRAGRSAGRRACWRASTCSTSPATAGA